LRSSLHPALGIGIYSLSSVSFTRDGSNDQTGNNSAGQKQNDNYAHTAGTAILGIKYNTQSGDRDGGKYSQYAAKNSTKNGP